MIDLQFLKGKTIGVVGLGKTGVASVKALQENGAILYVWDDKEENRDLAVHQGFRLLDLNTQSPDFILWSPGIPHYGPKANSIALQAKEKNIQLVSDIDIFSHAIANDVLVVTGTNGKSTTTALIAHTLGAFRPTRAGGNLGEAALSLDPLPENGTYILELSSYQLELSPSLKPAGAVLLNITPDHLERHGDFETYTAAKENIFASIQQGRKPTAVICVDSEITKQIAGRVKARGNWTVIPVSTQHKVDGVYVENGRLHDGNHVFDLSQLVSLKGAHNHENAACAYAVIRHVYGYEPDAIFKTMASFEGLPHRQFRVRNINGVSYINDSKATNADAVSHALACTKNIYWILGGRPKDGGLKGLEQYMERITHAFVIGEAAEEFSKWLKTFEVPVTISETLDVAVLEAHRMAQAKRGQPGEAATVLLSPACASWDQFKSFEHRGDVFTALVQALPEEG